MFSVFTGDYWGEANHVYCGDGRSHSEAPQTLDSRPITGSHTVAASAAREGRQHLNHGTIVERDRLLVGAAHRVGVYQER
jgi:hypothetical protein